MMHGKGSIDPMTEKQFVSNELNSHTTREQAYEQLVFVPRHAHDCKRHLENSIEPLQTPSTHQNVESHQQSNPQKAEYFRFSSQNEHIRRKDVDDYE